MDAVTLALFIAGLALPTFSAVMLLFVVPLTIITLAVVIARQMRRELRTG